MKRICVYCGSAVGASSVYVQMAEKLAIELVKRNIELVYGGAQVGVMGSIANSVLAAGGSVIGVLPVGLFRTEVPHDGLTQLIEVSSLHERKAKMAEISDAFIALPGGLGTLEELFDGVRKINYKSYLRYLYFNIGRLAYLQANVLVGYVLLAPAIVAGVMTLGVMQQILRAFGRVEGSLQYLFKAWPTIIELASVYRRLREFEKQSSLRLNRDREFFHIEVSALIHI